MPAVATTEAPPAAPALWRWLCVETPASRRTCLAVAAAGLLALLLIILSGPRHLVYDEVFHLTTVKVLLRTGCRASS